MSETQKLQLKFKSTVLEFLGWIIRWVGVKANSSYWGFLGGAAYEGYVMIGEPKLQLKGAIIPAGIRKAGEWQDYEIQISCQNENDMVSVDLEYPEELTDFVTRLAIDANNEFKSRRSIDEQVQTENQSTGHQKEAEEERAAGQQEQPPISNKPRVPTRKADLRRWNYIWNIVRGKVKTYRNIKALCEWFNESQARTPGITAIGTATQREKARERCLKCSEDTMADIVAAGEVGLLEFPKIP